jgi:hypothetical protein
MRGGGFGSVKGIFSKNIIQSNVCPEDQVALNEIIPDSDREAIRDFNLQRYRACGAQHHCTRFA